MDVLSAAQWGCGLGEVHQAGSPVKTANLSCKLGGLVEVGTWQKKKGAIPESLYGQKKTKKTTHPTTNHLSPRNTCRSESRTAPRGGHSYESAKSSWWVRTSYTHLWASATPEGPRRQTRSADFSNVDNHECQSGSFLSVRCAFIPFLTLEIISWINPPHRAEGTKRTLFPITSQDWSFVLKKKKKKAKAHTGLFRQPFGPKTNAESFTHFD